MVNDGLMVVEGARGGGGVRGGHCPPRDQMSKKYFFDLFMKIFPTTEGRVLRKKLNGFVCVGSKVKGQLKKTEGYRIGGF